MEIYELTVLEGRRPNSRCRQDWFFLMVVKENLFLMSRKLGSFGYAQVFLGF